MSFVILHLDKALPFKSKHLLQVREPNYSLLIFSKATHSTYTPVNTECSCVEDRNLFTARHPNPSARVLKQCDYIPTPGLLSRKTVAPIGIEHEELVAVRA